MDPLIGQRALGRYRVVKFLAKGGMGVIYLARQEGAAGFAKPVIVKLVAHDTTHETDAVKMFVREAHILANMRHPNIVQVVDFGRESDGTYVMVLEYVHGYNLALWHRYVKSTRGRYPIEIAIHIIVRVLEALNYAHTLKRADGGTVTVVHRDISPSNVLLDAEGHVKLVDFGIARMSSMTSDYQTASTTLKGKFAYMAPELFAGASPSPATDIYGCGVLLHELLIGKNELAGASPSDTVRRVLTQGLSSVRAARPDVPKELDSILAVACHRDPAERYRDAAAFARALREIRSISDEEATEQLAALVREDFGDAMAQKLGLTPLTLLERAWRDDAPDSRPPLGDAMIPTITVEASQASGGVGADDAKSTARPPERARATWARVVPIALVAVAAVAAGAWALSRSASDDVGDAQSGFIVVERPGDRGGAGPEPDPGGETGVQPAGDVAEPTGTTESTGVDPASPRDDGRGPAKTKAPPTAAQRTVALTRAFARRGPEVEACFARHAAAIQGSPRIAVTFRVASEGTVESVELTPAAVASSPLGTCLLGVARSTRFPPQPEPTAFRIPLEVESR